MLNNYIIEEKTLEKALLKCEKELDITTDKIFYTENYEKGGLLKSSKVILNVVKKEDVMSFINEYFNKLSKSLNIKINCDIRINEDIIRVNLNSEDASALIGKNGKMLNSIQVLLKKSIETQSGLNLKVNLDIEGYKERKIEKLEKNIRKIVKEVLTTKVDVKLDEMNSYERRIVHNIVSEYENLTSESEGVAPHRYVVIKYIER